MKIFIGADHRGFELKGKIILELLSSMGNEYIEDCGAFEFSQNDDYVDYAKKVSEKVLANEGSRGIVICGSGVGVDIVANRIKGIKCGLGFNPDQVRNARNDDDINVLALGSDFIDFDGAKRIVKSFLETPFDPAERHQRRIKKIEDLEGGDWVNSQKNTFKIFAVLGTIISLSLGFVLLFGGDTFNNTSFGAGLGLGFMSLGILGWKSK